MPQRPLARIRSAIRETTYDTTVHAVEEMAEDGLQLVDLEASVLNGKVVRSEKDDLRGMRYTVHGKGADGMTPVGTVGRFTGTGRYLIITVYRITE
jgi:hypothetical protein